ncbi:hypothetical protein GW17_00062403, partial [Ensete ventricosum]
DWIYPLLCISHSLWILWNSQLVVSRTRERSRLAIDLDCKSKVSCQAVYEMGDGRWEMGDGGS